MTFYDLIEFALCFYPSILILFMTKWPPIPQDNTSLMQPSHLSVKSLTPYCVSPALKPLCCCLLQFSTFLLKIPTPGMEKQNHANTGTVRNNITLAWYSPSHATAALHIAAANHRHDFMRCKPYLGAAPLFLAAYVRIWWYRKPVRLTDLDRSRSRSENAESLFLITLLFFTSSRTFASNVYALLFTPLR